MSEPLERLRILVGDRYHIEGEVGHGGMAVVYRAEDLRHRRKVALKVLRPELTAILGAERFLEEIRIIAQLQHPHVLPLFDSGNADGLLFYVMPYVEGESVRQKLARERQLSIDEAVQITAQVATALDYAHRHGVVHRDIKPENILLADGQALVVDFGIALAVSSAAGDRLTEVGLSVGTPQYMSPEQATGDRNLDGRTDTYSLACVLYEMLTGEPPHTGATLQALVARISVEKPRPISEVRESVPRHVAAALHKALAKVPADRFAHAAAFAAALTRTGDSAAVFADAAVPFAKARPARRFQLRSAAVAWVVTGAVALVATAVTLQQGSGSGGPAGVVHFTIPVPAQQLRGGAFPSFALSPDGRSLIYRGPDGRLLLRDLGVADAVPVPGSEGSYSASFSPDGEWIAIFHAGQLKKIPTRGGPAALKLSPDGKRVAISVRDPANQDIWLRETATGRAERVTFGLAEEEYAVWSPDGRSLAYTRTVSGGKSDIYVKSVGSADDPKLVFSGTTHLHPTSWSPDGRSLLLNEATRDMAGDIRVLNIDGTSNRLVASGPGSQSLAVFSPDGRWIAYQSDETGRVEVYTVSFPELSGKQQVSTEGGRTPKWAPDGSALFYRNGRRLLTVPVSFRPTLSWGATRDLFETDALEYEIAPDGNRLLLLVPNPEAERSEIHIVLNWFQELKQRERAAAK